MKVFLYIRRILVKILATAVNKLYSNNCSLSIKHRVNNCYVIKKMKKKSFNEEEINKIKESKEYIEKDLLI